MVLVTGTEKKDENASLQAGMAPQPTTPVKNAHRLCICLGMDMGPKCYACGRVRDLSDDWY